MTIQNRRYRDEAVEPEEIVPASVAPAKRAGRAARPAYSSKHLLCPECKDDTLDLIGTLLVCPECGYCEGCCD